MEPNDDELFRLHLVLKHKITDRVASRKDQRQKAIMLEAQRLTQEGQGDGIASLLNPKSRQEENDASQIGATYNAVRVAKRSGAKSGTSDRKALAEAVGDGALMLKLVTEFETHIKSKPSPHAVSAKNFTRWLYGELVKRDSVVYTYAQENATVLFEAKRGERWWADAFRKRRKTQS